MYLEMAIDEKGETVNFPELPRPHQSDFSLLSLVL